VSRVEEPIDRHRAAHELTGLQLKVVSIAAVIMILGGLAALGSGRVDEVVATFEQHQMAIESDATITRYASALDSAYEVVVSDFEDAFVSFEFGALPTTVDGHVIGHSPPLSASAREPEQIQGADLRAALDEDPVIAVPEEDLKPTPTSFVGGVIRIPAIDVNQPVGEGVSREHLKLGPGHYPGTALPGEAGNVVISGHRTTYSRPFHDLDRLASGDAVFVDTSEGTFRYLVSETLVVSADDGRPLRDTEEARLTLTTCHPKGSARERLVVVAYLDEGTNGTAKG